MVSRKSLNLWLVGLCLWLVPALTLAQDEASRARTLFEQGIELVDQERWGEAAEAFRKSYALVPRPSSAYNLGNALYRLGKPASAMRAFRTFLQIADSEQDAADRATAQEVMERLSKVVVTLQVDVSVPDASVRIDRDPPLTGSFPQTVLLDPGEHTLLASAPGHAEREHTLQLEAGERTQVSLSLDAVSAVPEPAEVALQAQPDAAQLPAQPEETQADTGPSQRVKRRRRILGVALGVLVAGAAATTGVLLAGQDESPYGGDQGVTLRP